MDWVMWPPKRCVKYDSTNNFYHQINNIIMPDKNIIHNVKNHNINNYVIIIHR